MEYEQGDLSLCIVDRIIGTTVFVKLPNGKEGTIITSEIAPGRIRNLREYVVPKKKIVCKVLKAAGENIHLSLRRVNQKEKKEVLEQYKQEKSYTSLFQSILKEKAKEVLEKISQEESIYDFLNEAKENPKKLEKIVGKENSEKILEIVNQQKSKKAILKKEFNLTTSEPSGIELIKKILEKKQNVEIKYISAGKYFIKTEADDLKKADNEIKKVVEEIETFAKKNNMEFKTK